jgi:hypothetical protein
MHQEKSGNPGQKHNSKLKQKKHQKLNLGNYFLG